jgi:hypothetical protein
VNYDDLVRDGGANWSWDDWLYLVFLPITLNGESLKLCMPYVAMMQHFYARGIWECPRDVRDTLSRLRVGDTRDEVLEFIRVWLCNANRFTARLMDAETEERLMRVAADDCLALFVEHCFINR